LISISIISIYFFCSYKLSYNQSISPYFSSIYYLYPPSNSLIIYILIISPSKLGSTLYYISSISLYFSSIAYFRFLIVMSNWLSSSYFYIYISSNLFNSPSFSLFYLVCYVLLSSNISRNVSISSIYYLSLCFTSLSFQ